MIPSHIADSQNCSYDNVPIDFSKSSLFAFGPADKAQCSARLRPLSVVDRMGGQHLHIRPNQTLNLKHASYATPSPRLNRDLSLTT